VPFHLVWAVLFNGLFRPVNRNVSLLAGFVMLMACMMWTLSSPWKKSLGIRHDACTGIGAATEMT